jgi:hypothetical protein
MTRLSLVLASFFACALSVLAGCSPGGGNGGCGTNADCSGGRMCAPDGSCVQCLANDDCAEGQFCCQGGCYEDGEQEARCGCAPSPSGSAGDACEAETNVCLVDGARATVENVAEGVCGCSCDAASGGTLCTVDGEGAFACTCDRADPTGTCERPALDEDGNPHIVADTCSPQETCVCFGEGAAPCDPSSDAPDCTATGCVNALNDVANCGVGGRLCSDPATGVADTGVCHDGGCSCDAPTDCQGAGLNVNQCAFVGEGVSQCVCDDYELADGIKGACPLGLECVEGGCSFEGTAYATRTSLLQALGVFP